VFLGQLVDAGMEWLGDKGIAHRVTEELTKPEIQEHLKAIRKEHNGALIVVTVGYYRNATEGPAIAQFKSVLVRGGPTMEKTLSDGKAIPKLTDANYDTEERYG
jgi:hypothetical protein